MSLTAFRSPFRLMPRAAGFATILALSALFAPAAGAESVQLDGSVAPYANLDTRAVQTLPFDRWAGGWSLNGEQYEFDGLIEAKLTSPGWLQSGNPNVRHDLAGSMVLFNDDGYLVISFETFASECRFPVNYGWFEITDAGGVFEGATRSGEVEVDFHLGGPDSVSTSWYFFGDPCP